MREVPWSALVAGLVAVVFWALALRSPRLADLSPGGNVSTMHFKVLRVVPHYGISAFVAVYLLVAPVAWRIGGMIS